MYVTGDLYVKQNKQDSKGQISHVFLKACEETGRIWEKKGEH